MGYFFLGAELGLLVTAPTYPAASIQLVIVQGCVLLAAGGIIRSVDKLRDVMKGNRNGN